MSPATTPRQETASLYLKLRDRASYEFAACVRGGGDSRQANGKIARARIALGGVGTKPWRSTEAEAELTDQPANEGDFPEAADAAFARRKAAKPKTPSRSNWPSSCPRFMPLKLATQPRLIMPQGNYSIADRSRHSARRWAVKGDRNGRQYASDFHFPGLLYGVPVEATIASGKITKPTPPPQRRCPASTRFCIVKTSGKIFRSTHRGRP